METPVRSRPRPASRRRNAVLGSLTIPGRPEEVRRTRAFVTRTLAAVAKGERVDSDAATLLTSELVTNAIRHSASGGPSGTVTIVIVGVPDGVLIEVIDDGSSATPTVRNDLLAQHGHGLHLVQQLAAQWGFLRDSGGTTVWFHLAGDAAGGQRRLRRAGGRRSRRQARGGGQACLQDRRAAFLPRFSRSRMVSLTGVPAKPNSSRSLRSMNRR
jgi:anti-sigma regulatory factor (Ser/Thr protein kinase)